MSARIVEEWLDWAAEANIATECIFFLKLRRKLLFKFNPNSEEHAFPTPRSWEFVSRMLADNGQQEMDSRLFVSCIRGAIGEGPAVEFEGFLHMWRNLEHPGKILADPKNANIPTEASTLLATCGAVVGMVDKDTIGAMVKYAMRSEMRPEVGEFMIGQAVTRKPELQKTRAYAKWVTHLSAR